MKYKHYVANYILNPPHALSVAAIGCGRMNYALRQLGYPGLQVTAYDERLHKAYKIFMDSGHSGCSAHLIANMIKRFCPDGADVADAVLNFRFGNKELLKEN